ncbi:hypothetical protein [Streptacidiphilus melanogenes]|uniref:hypothetical protein n=1 Tax=Streptacidiphilus melanogenes TaxID=411235 RepID=UPI00126A3A84|nr:hypothetical protein [Streptacidiphilus melanogenes]
MLRRPLGAPDPDYNDPSVLIVHRWIRRSAHHTLDARLRLTQDLARELGEMAAARGMRCVGKVATDYPWPSQFSRELTDELMRQRPGAWWEVLTPRWAIIRAWSAAEPN